MNNCFNCNKKNVKYKYNVLFFCSDKCYKHIWKSHKNLINTNLINDIKLIPYAILNLAIKYNEIQLYNDTVSYIKESKKKPNYDLFKCKYYDNIEICNVISSYSAMLLYIKQNSI